MIRLIAALDSCRGLATDAGIPWRLPRDSAYFREKTSMGLIVMGRATYLEFAAPLGERDNLVLTHSAEPLRPGFRPMASLEEALATSPDEAVWVIGGAAVYALAVDVADELLLTQVQGDFRCTKFFPPYPGFTLAEFSIDHTENDVSYRFERWERLAGKPDAGALPRETQVTESASGVTAPS